MKVLRVGDPHVMVSNLKDSQRLIDFVVDIAKKEGAIIEFLGDLFHTHAVIRVEVIDFWKKAFDRIENENIECRVLVGNHDQPGSKEKEQLMNSLNMFEKKDNTGAKRFIINRPMNIGNIAYIPYMSDHESFVSISKELYDKGAQKLLVAHQTFTGATYDNGFFAEDGIDPALVSQDNIISGHIHKAQTIGKCEYPGTAKWDTMSDANQDKGLWLYTHDETGTVTDKKFYSTKEVVTPIVKYVIEEGSEEPTLVDGHRNYIELVGKTAWISKMKKLYKGKAHLKATPTDRKRVNIKESKLLTIQDYIDKDLFIPIDGINKSDIIEYLKDI